MEMSHVVNMMAVVLSCLLVAAVWCTEEQRGSQLEGMAGSRPQKRSISNVPSADIDTYSPYVADDDTDKRSSLFRFGKRGTLFRFGKRGTPFRYGKRSSLFRFGKRASYDSFDDDMGDESMFYPSVYVPDNDLKRVVKSFHWGRETEK